MHGPLVEPGEASVGDQGAALIHATAHDQGCGHMHLPHAGTTLGPLVGDHQNVAVFDLVIRNGVAGLLHGVEHPGPALEVVHGRLDAGYLDHGALGGDVAVEDSQAALLPLGGGQGEESGRFPPGARPSGSPPPSCRSRSSGPGSAWTRWPSSRRGCLRPPPAPAEGTGRRA